jgi:hypothetical protein
VHVWRFGLESLRKSHHEVAFRRLVEPERVVDWSVERDEVKILVEDGLAVVRAGEYVHFPLFNDRRGRLDRVGDRCVAQRVDDNRTVDLLVRAQGDAATASCDEVPRAGCRHQFVLHEELKLLTQTGHSQLGAVLDDFRAFNRLGVGFIWVYEGDVEDCVQVAVVLKRNQKYLTLAWHNVQRLYVMFVVAENIVDNVVFLRLPDHLNFTERLDSDPVRLVFVINSRRDCSRSQSHLPDAIDSELSAQVCVQI